MAAASDSALPYPHGYSSFASRAAMRSPPHTIADEKMSAVDSIASAMSAYELPNTPATSLTAASTALARNPTCAARMPRAFMGVMEGCARWVGSRR